MSDNSEDDEPQLRAETFNALQEFLNEEVERNSTEHNVNENWQLSQFWYDDSTTKTLVQSILKSVNNRGKIALISCPTLYSQVKERLEENGEVHLYEFDERFQMYGDDFVKYDYKTPLALSKDKSHYYDIVVADPPFLSEECLTKTAITIRYLTKEKIILCTGTVMAELAKRLLKLEPTSFKPQHKNNLGNDFSCFTNFAIDL